MQGANLERELKVRVMDRAEVILDIFSTRARSHEAKLQVELAQLEYLLPAPHPHVDPPFAYPRRHRPPRPGRDPARNRPPDHPPADPGAQGQAQGVERHRENLRAGRDPMLSVVARRLHQRRQVEHPARALGPARDRGRGPPVRHARHADARSGAGRGAARADHRHGRLHPEAAAPPGRELPRHARGGARRRPAAARGGREPSGLGRPDARRRAGARRARAGRPADSRDLQQDGRGAPTRSRSRRACGSCTPPRSWLTTMRTDGLEALKARLRELEREGRSTVRVRLPVADGARVA